MPAALDSAAELHAAAGRRLFEACGGQIFPCDGIAFSVLERSLHLVKSFRLIYGAGGYSSAAGICRMQMDNLLRFQGLLRTKDPHEAAYAMIGGTPLRKLKDRDGAAMTDQYLVQLVAKRLPTLQTVYQATSGFIHLSDRHFWQFFNRAPKREDGHRDFSIGEDESYIPEEQRSELLRTFTLFTETVPKLVDGWTGARVKHGSNSELLERFPRAA